MKKKIKNKRLHPLIKGIAIGSAIALTANFSSACTKAPQQQPNNDNVDMSNQTTDKQSNPNVIYIVLDDMGFSDLGSYGSEIKTPNIDELAKNGLRYNNFNVCPVSSPTRASLLTGRNANEVGMGFVADVALGDDRPTVQARVTPAAGTIMEVLKENDYSTLGIGKYHMTPGYTINPAGPFDNWPLTKGFERYYGFLMGETDQYRPQLVSGNELIEAPDTPGYTINEDLLAHAKQFIGDQVSVYPNKPFFMNFAFGTSHSPLQVPEEYIDMYDGVYDKGWDIVRQERFERQKEMGIIPSDTQLAPADPRLKAWDSLSSDEQKLFARFMQCYAGFITQADEQVGELVNYLKATGEYDNTMIVLIADNGATDVGGPDGTDSFIGALGGRIPTAADLMPKYDMIGTEEMAALYPAAWAQVGNTPFQGYKAGLYAGGVRAPLIISWPNADFPDKGQIRSQYVDVSDITATVYDVLKITPPEELKGVTQMPISGVSIASTFYDADAPEVRDTQYYFMNNYSSIYNNGWKAIAKHKVGTSFEEDVWELYKVSEDYAESTNVADQYPDKVKELKELFMVEAEKYGNMPLQEFVQGRDMAYIRQDSPQSNATFKYYPEMGHVGTQSAPPIPARSQTITVPVYRANKDVEGVLVAMGDNIGGYTMYVKNNKLVYEFNRFGTIFKITSDIDVPTGESVLKYVYTSTGIFSGIGELYIDDQKTGGEIEIQTAPMITFEGLDVGKDLMLPVSEEYADEGTFEFEGKIQYVQFDLKPFIPAGPPKEH